MNSALVVAPAGPYVAAYHSFVSIEGVELALGAMKPAEDRDGIILRLYEPHGARGVATLSFAAPIGAVEPVNLLEDSVDDLSVESSRRAHRAVSGSSVPDRDTACHTELNPESLTTAEDASGNSAAIIFSIVNSSNVASTVAACQTVSSNQARNSHVRSELRKPMIGPQSTSGCRCRRSTWQTAAASPTTRS